MKDLFMDSDSWGTYTFGELIARGVLEIGDGYRAKNSELGGDGLIFLRAGHVSDTEITLDGAERFCARLTAQVSSKTSRPGDVLVTTKGNSTGRVAFVSERMPTVVYSPHLSYWRSHDVIQLVPSFLRAWSRGAELKHQVMGLAHGTDMAPYLSLIDQRRLRITLPPPAEQRAIAHILSTLDDKIELNRQMNQTLEQIAAAFFRSWFVDFDPVRAKTEGRQPAGMDAETAALFPDRFVESEVGEIPEGWLQTTVGDQVAMTKGRSYKSDQLVPSPMALVTLKSFLRHGGYRSDGLKAYDGPFKPEQVVLPGEIVVALTDVTQAAEVIGRPALVQPDSRFEKLVASLDVGIVRPLSDELPVLFLLHLMSDDRFSNHTGSYASGTTVLHLNTQGITSYPFPLPPVPLLAAFDRIVSPLHERRTFNHAEATTLSELRDALLPRLLSGKLRVPTDVLNEEVAQMSTRVEGLLTQSAF